MSLVDVVILTWNDGDLLAHAVDSALASDGVDVNVIVVDNGSDPPAVVPADDRVRLVRNAANRGVAPGRNQGAAAGAAEYLCFLDSDARLLPGTLAALVEPLEAADRRVALAGPVFTGQAPEASAGRAPTAARKLGRLLGRYDGYEAVPHAGGDPWWAVDFTIGACQLIRRSAFDAVGRLDDSIFYGPEDVDFCLRLKEAGYEVVQVDVGCHHPPRRTSRRIVTRRAWRHGWQVARHLWRHRRPSHPRQRRQPRPALGARHGAS